MRKSFIVVGSVAGLVGALAAALLMDVNETPEAVAEDGPTKADASVDVELPAEMVAKALDRLVQVTEPAVVEREGIRFHFELLRDRRADPGARQRDVTLNLQLTDELSGEPIRGLHPLVWMWRREGDAPPDEKAYREKVKTYLGGLLSAQAEVDFNTYLALTLNNDNTVSVINPQIAFSRTKLKALVALPAAAADWAVDHDRDRAYASLPGPGRLAVIDSARGKMRGSFQVGSNPNRVAVAPDRSVWVGNDGDDSVSVREPGAEEPRGQVEVAAGKKSISFDPLRRTAWLAASEGTHLVVADLKSLERTEGPEVGEGVIALAWASHGSVLLALREAAGELVIVDSERREVVGRVQTGGKPQIVGVEPTGRWAFLLEREGDRVVVVDTATSRIRQYVTGLKKPDALAFTKSFAYVRQSDDPRMALIPLIALQREEKLDATFVVVAQKAPSEAYSPGLASAIAPLPEGSGVLVAAPADKAVYAYMGGMMAASGSHPNYGREPRAVMLVDRSLRERLPGRYVAHGEVPEPGMYDAAILVDSPRVAVCVSQRIDSDERRVREPPLVVELLSASDEPFVVGEPAVLRFKVRDPKRPEPLRAEELLALIQRPPTTFSLSQRPTQRADGSFEVSFVPEEAGLYKLLLGARGRGVEFGAVRPLDVRVKGPTAGGEER